MSNLRDYIPALKYGAKILPSEVAGMNAPLSNGKVIFVDGDMSSGGAGTTFDNAYATIQAAINAASAGDLIQVAEKTLISAANGSGAGGTATDPVSYTEALTIPDGKSHLTIQGISRGRTQGGLPQLKIGSTTTSPLLTIQAAGCLITGLGFNGAGATGGGILLDDDAGTTTAVFGTTIAGCHFKNCKGTTATDSRTGGAIMWTADGGAWQTLISGNDFYKNVGDIVLKGTSVSVPQDVVIEDNTFMGTAATVDCHIYLAGGSGMANVVVNNNVFAGVLPALGSGSIVRYADLTGCTGIFSNNYFAGSYTTTGFGVAKVAAKIPTTVGIVHNYSDAGLIVREA